MSEHTPEPWELYEGGCDGPDSVAGKTGHVCTCELNEDARRIVACVNACKGIDTEVLEKIEDPQNQFDILGLREDALHRGRETAQAQADRAMALLRRFVDELPTNSWVHEEARVFLAAREDKG